MRVAVACDHAGYALKNDVIATVAASGHEVSDLGAYSPESIDYPDIAQKLGQYILGGQAERGILLCGSGVGACIAANKIKGIYAGVCHDHYSAHQGVEHDNMNVLCLGARVIGSELAKELVVSFVNATFSPEDRHVRRTAKVRAIEAAGK